MESLPSYVSVVFILTTFVTVGFLLHAIKFVGANRLPSQILIFILPLWIFFQAALSLGGFYQQTDSYPPRMLLFGVGPALLMVAAYFVLFREDFINKLPLRTMTILHVVRIPVELVLYWLFVGRQVPEIMTFEGRNFDIISGLLAPIVFLLGFGRSGTRRWILVAYNLLGIILLANIVSTAFISLPSPIQMIAFEQPNRAVLFFPYIWLPTIVVPIVFFAHLSSLWKIFSHRDD